MCGFCVSISICPYNSFVGLGVEPEPFELGEHLIDASGKNEFISVDLVSSGLLYTQLE